MGIEPVWARDGQELLYRKGATGDLVAVEVETEGGFSVGEERVLFPAGMYRSELGHPQYDVAADGQRFVMLRVVGMAEEVPDPPMVMIMNFFAELEQRLGGGG
jgi:hypothetical protein